jgi:hypothetical protein
MIPGERMLHARDRVKLRNNYTYRGEIAYFVTGTKCMVHWDGKRPDQLEEVEIKELKHWSEP